MPLPRDPRVAVVGATGVVGNQIIDLIGARGFQLGELKLFATAAGSAQTLDAGGEEQLVEPLASPEDLRGFDLAFLAIPSDAASEIIIATPGPIIIDLSSANRTPSDLPLVAPGLTPRARFDQLLEARLFTIPHPAAHVLATCLNALGAHTVFVAATAMLGASAGGRDMLTTTVDQTTDLLSARLALDDDVVQRGFNVFMREHERSVANVIGAQVISLLDRSPVLALQVAGMPVLHGSALAINLPALIDGGDARELLRIAPGVLIAEEGEPLGVIDAVGQEAIVVSVDESPGTLALWCVFDNTRLAALGALWIAETLALGSSTLT
jgi:aspartate-semialdehyde dehydrogenase